MTSIRDRTEDYKDAVRSAALSMGYSESELAAVLASFILRKPPERSPFTKAASKTLERIRELESFIVKHRKDYVDLHRTTERDRDDIENEVSVFIKACKELIDILKDSINVEEKNKSSRSWLSLRDDTSRADLVAHKHGVVLILSERLHEVTLQFDKLRTIRFQDAVNKAIPRKKLQKVAAVRPANIVPEPDRGNFGSQELASRPATVQAQLLDDETQALQVELAGLLEAVQETETKMVEMSALNHLMSTHVLQQAQQIEQLYEQAVEATRNVELGNKELSKAIKRNSGSRTFLLLFLFVLTFSILFLDWYS